MNIIDLFAGCGGFSEGFRQAGFRSVFALERDVWASETYGLNHPKVPLVTADITGINDPRGLLSSASEIDGIIGGPPCQGFSLSGNRDPKDPRNSLFGDFVRFVGVFRPRFVVMENVTGILSMKTREGVRVTDIIRAELEALKYNVAIHTLNAAEFGVPQSRQRVFFIGLRGDIKFNWQAVKPVPTHAPPQFVTLQDAISDLPSIGPGEGSEAQEYASEPQNSYQAACRTGSLGVFNHVAMKHTGRLVARFASIGFGQSVKDVEEVHAQRKRGNAAEISGKSFSQNNMRPFPDKPCPTIAASFQSNFIHPFLNRNFTAREGARIQSFPDRYIFCGKRTTMSWEKHLSQYQQIGNAVPPQLARAIAERLKWYLHAPDNVASLPARGDYGSQLALL